MGASDVVLQVLDGKDTIGGSKILVGWGGEGVFLDFGINYGRWGRYFEEFVKPRTTNGLGDLWRLGLVPQVRDLYRTDVMPAFAQTQGKPLPVKRVTGVYLSHAHLDHAGLIGLMDAAIPLVSSRMSAAILKGIQDAKKQDIFAQSIYHTPYTRKTVAGQDVFGTAREGVVGRDIFLADGAGPAAFGSFMNMLPEPGEPGRGKKAEYDPGTIRTLQPSSGGVHAREAPVDHSVLGASGFTIETPQGPIVYSGDLRAHGRQGGATNAFLEGLKARPPWILLMEGTQVRPLKDLEGEREEPTTEQEVEANCLKVVERYKGKLVVADFGPRNIERLQSFLAIAKRTGRRLVIVPKDAYLLHAMNAADPTVPVPHDSLLVFDVPSAKAPDKWERFILERYGAHVLHARDVDRRQAELILCFSFFDIKHLLDIEPRGGCYIYSSSEAHNEEQEIDMERLTNWLQLLRLDPIGYNMVDVPNQRHRAMRKVRGYHASGHMPGLDVLDWVMEIRPEHLVPIHTEHAARFAEHVKGTGIRILDGGLP